MDLKWQHIQFEDGRNPYICKTAEEFEHMKSKYDLEYLCTGMWLVKAYERISDWLEIQYREITEDMKEYTDEENYWQPGFEWDGEFRFLSDFIRTHNNAWSGIKTPAYIHGYDGTEYFHPLYIEIDEGGESVRLYKSVNRT